MIKQISLGGPFILPKTRSQMDDIIRKIYNLIFVQSAKIKFRNRCPKSTCSIHIMVLRRECIKSKIVQQIHEYIPNSRVIP